MIKKIEEFLLMLLFAGLLTEIFIAPVLLTITAFMIELEFMKYLLLWFAMFSVIINIIIIIFACVIASSEIEDSNDIDEPKKTEESN